MAVWVNEAPGFMPDGENKKATITEEVGMRAGK